MDPKEMDGKDPAKIMKQALGKFESLVNEIGSPEGMATLRSLIDYTRRFRPDLHKELLGLRGEMEVLYGQVLSGQTPFGEKFNSEFQGIFGRLASVVSEVVKDSSTRGWAKS